jgi:hypothetical protein
MNWSFKGETELFFLAPSFELAGRSLACKKILSSLFIVRDKILTIAGHSSAREHHKRLSSLAQFVPTQGQRLRAEFKAHH